MQATLRFWSASFLVQLFARLLSFASNQFLIRLLTPTDFGVWSVNLSLMSETLVFWAREGVRKAATRSRTSHFRYAILPFLLGIVLVPIVVASAFKFAAGGPGFPSAVYLTSAGALCELAGELWAVPQLASLNGGPVAKVTSFAFLVRSFFVVIAVKYYGLLGDPSRLMLCFGSANFLFGLLIVAGFLFKCGLPTIESPTLAELKSLLPFGFQTILQWLFSQGERMVLLLSSTPEQIGVYGFVSDLSSLVARIVFAPIESSIFSICASSEKVPVDVLTLASRFVVCIGLAAAAFGPKLAPPILAAIYGAKWTGSEAIATFAAVCRVLPLMALNGVTEAVANARLADRRLELYNVLLAGVTVIYFTLMAVANRYCGPPGAVYANGVNMGIRSAMAVSVIFRECGRLRSIVPLPSVIAAFVGTALLAPFTRYSVVLALVPVVGGLVLFTEKNAIQFLIGLLKKAE
jgi:oligosaccharide translocation protein RFT1